MAKAAYVGVNGTPKKITNMYVGVNGTPKKVLKGYVGVNGVPKLFWESSAQAYSWDLWTTVEGQQLFTDDSVFTVSKRYGKIAFWGLVPNSTHSGYYTPILMSPDPQARAAWVRVRNTSTGSATTYGAITNIEDVNGNTWYCACPQQAMLEFNSAPSFLITDEIKTIDEYAQIFLDKIYAVPFHESYVVGEDYTLNLIDNELTLRKALGTYLWWLISDYGTQTEMTALSDNADTIMSTLLTSIGNDTFVHIVIGYLSGDAKIYVYHATTTIGGHAQAVGDYNGFDSAFFTNVSLPNSISREIVSINSSGTISYTSDTVSDETLYPYVANAVGVGLDVDSGTVVLSNAGIDL